MLRKFGAFFNRVIAATESQISFCHFKFAELVIRKHRRITKRRGSKLRKKHLGRIEKPLICLALFLSNLQLPIEFLLPWIGTKSDC